MPDHYHVSHNVPGYQPLSDPYVVDTVQDAKMALADEIKRYLDEESQFPPEQRRTVVERLATAGADANVVILSCPNDPHDLGHAFQWLACANADCPELAAREN